MSANVQRYELLGEGAYARTFSVVLAAAGPDAAPIAAVKIFERIDSDSIRLHFDRERIALRALSSGETGHACLIRYLHSYIDDASKEGAIFLELGPDTSITVRTLPPTRSPYTPLRAGIS